METKALAWECECGKIEYSEYPPESCSKCWEINGFVKKESNDELEDILEDLG